MSTASIPMSIRSPRQRPETSSRTVVLLCYLGFLLSFSDRAIFSMVLKPIKASLHFTDSQLGLLVGPAFAVAYSIFCMISGPLVDRFSRKIIMISAIGFWSLMTFSTGLASTFLMMVLARGLVGAGEAFMHPLAMSLISDTVPAEGRPKVFSFYMSAAAVGGIAAQLLVGTLLHLLVNRHSVSVPALGLLPSWRIVFLSAALPGILLVMSIVLFLRDPAHVVERHGPSDPGNGLIAFAREHGRLLLALMGGVAVCQIPSATLASFIVLFFGRVHGWTVAHAAFAAGAPGALAALIGCLCAGAFIQALKRRGYADAPIRVAVIGGVIFAVLGTAGVLIPNASAAVVLLVSASFFTYLPGVAMYSSMGEVLPPATRGRLTGNIIAVGILTGSAGPYLVGLFSDRLFPTPAGISQSLALTFTSVTILGVAVALSGMAAYRRRVFQMEPGILAAEPRTTS